MSSVHFCEIRLHPEILSTQNLHIWSSNMHITVGTQTCTLCSAIASDIPLIFFSPYLLTTLVNLVLYKHEHKG